MTTNNHTYAVILAGGGGTRLWPKSRLKVPKQFLQLDGEDTMIQVTANRFAKIIAWDKIIVVTTKKYLELVRQQLPKVSPENIIAEPEKRDTAMAMLVGALFAKSKDPEAVLINDAADHVIQNEGEFLRLMELSAKIASDHQYLVAVGIIPTFPSTAFGYIKTGKEWKKIGRDTVFQVDSFVEKPNKPTARAFISSGKYFWNANHYVWSAKALKEAFKKYRPDMYSATRHLDSLDSSTKFMKALPAVYEAVESISVDYAISEKADNLLIIPGDFGWDDIGEWKVVYDLTQKDNQQNAIIGPEKKSLSLLIDSTGNLVHTDNRMVTMVGVKNMIIIDTGEILLVCPMDRSQEVKKLVEKLKKDNRKEYL
ncbi:MAG TPA: sugar phosphate nucleotidyltransferase [Patescibacteria group bacterium]|jgi:mannose-1-phosphate guanylyltransferase